MQNGQKKAKLEFYGKATYRFLSKDDATKQLIFQALHSYSKVNNGRPSTYLLTKHTNKENQRMYVENIILLLSNC